LTEWWGRKTVELALVQQLLFGTGLRDEEADLKQEVSE
jgi:hypothetical protein